MLGSSLLLVALGGIADPSATHAPSRGVVSRSASASPPSAALRARREWLRLAPEVQVSAAELAAKIQGQEDVSLDASGVQLVYLPRRGRFERVWEVELPLRLSGGRPTRQTRWYSVANGVELLRREHVRPAWARVFPVSPAASSIPIDVELSVDGVRLEGERTSVWGCSPTPLENPVPWRFAGECYPQQRVTADTAGDFRVPLPGIDFEDGFLPSDMYAEVSLYYHAERFQDALADLGDYRLPCEHVKLHGNYTARQGDDIVPVDNAYYTGSCEERPMVIFGQGEYADYAYDGDVIYHELGHGVIDAETPWGLWRPTCDDVACFDDAGALAEALADYMAVILTEDPFIGEYIAQRQGLTRRGIRNLDAVKRCPDALVGALHVDSELVSGALWTARQALGPRLDAVVLDTLAGLPEDAHFEEFAAHLIDVAATADSDGSVARTLTETFADRGLLDCSRVVPFETGRTIVLSARPAEHGDAQPGPAQVEVSIPLGAESIRVVYEVRVAGSEDEDSYPILDPVVWAWAALDGPVMLSEGADVQGRPTMGGAADQRVQAAVVSQTQREIVLDVSEANGSVWIALGNSHSLFPMEVTLTEVEVQEPSDAAVAGCSQAPRRRHGGLLVWLGVVLVSIGRRRRCAPRKDD